ncbi:uncharacterized protein LOC143541210 [Bidens hawaiensis]|uniref:uncharacterized protein LOC143541210 n=1 Tax=Bidens hawaiensis TaxID=980011 RepID=UPI00404B1ABC
MTSSLLIFTAVVCLSVAGVKPAYLKSTPESDYAAVGDPGMKRDGLRVAFEGWNFCNEVGVEAPAMGSPRAADCFDLLSTSKDGYCINHKVTEHDNHLGVGNPFPRLNPKSLNDPDLYAAEKELYLGELCQVGSTGTHPWKFWMIMLKNGNYDTTSGLCPENGKKVPPFSMRGRFPCFGAGCMNQPMLDHQPTAIEYGKDKLVMSQISINDPSSKIQSPKKSIQETKCVVKEEIQAQGRTFKDLKKQVLLQARWSSKNIARDQEKLRENQENDDKRELPESPNFRVKLTLDVKKGGGPKSQFYLIDMGSCWKNNGQPCDGDVLTDITRYSEMIINPEIPAWCAPSALANCPPYHITPNDTKIYRNDTARFPYGAYHYYCAPGNAAHLEKPYSTCDPYSNPQAQELVQLLPHPIWAEYGFPTKQGDGWVGDARTWELDVGGLSSRLYFYQDPGTTAAKRLWTSLDV